LSVKCNSINYILNDFIDNNQGRYDSVKDKEPSLDEKKFLNFLFSYTLCRISSSNARRKCITNLINLFKNNKYEIDDFYYDQIKDSPNDHFCQVVCEERLNLAKAIVLVTKQKNITGFDEKTGFGIFHELILEQNKDVLLCIINFLQHHQKTKLLKKFLETKANPIGTLEQVKKMKNKTPLEGVHELIKETDEKVEFCNYHEFNEIPENINNDRVKYTEIKDILTTAQLFIKNQDLNKFY